MFNPNRESIASFASDIGKCQTILKVVHKEMIKIQEELQMGCQRSTADKTLHRYYWSDFCMDTVSSQELLRNWR